MVSRILAASVGALLAVAGASKFFDMPAWMRDARAQGVWTPVARVVPAVEVVLGACLVALEPNPVTLGAATLLLLIFTVFLAVSVAAKSTAPCACFGSVRRRAPRWRDVVRNLVLMSALFASAVLI